MASESGMTSCTTRRSLGFGFGVHPERFADGLVDEGRRAPTDSASNWSSSEDPTHPWHVGRDKAWARPRKFQSKVLPEEKQRENKKV